MVGSDGIPSGGGEPQRADPRRWPRLGFAQVPIPELVSSPTLSLPRTLSSLHYPTPQSPNMPSVSSYAALASLAAVASAQLSSSAPVSSPSFLLPRTGLGAHSSAGRLIETFPVVQSCVTGCFAAKLAEGPTYYGTTDIPTLCAIPTFVAAYSNCLSDHCTATEMAEGLLLGQQVSNHTPPACWFLGCI